MLETAKHLVAHALKVPPRPDPPLGAPGSVRVFRAGKGFLLYSQLRWLLQQGWVLVGGLVGLYFLNSRVFDRWPSWAADKTADQLVLRFGAPEPLEGLLESVVRTLYWAGTKAYFEGWIDAAAVGFFLAQLPITWLIVHLSYEYRWYMITDRSLRIREGVWKVREQTMTFSNIQNIAIRQGPLQRLLGLSDVEVRTAGGGSKSGDGKSGDAADSNLHLGRFRGVSNPQEIHDAIKARMGAGRVPPVSDHASDQPLRAASRLLEEARRLRAVATGDSPAKAL